MSRDLLPLTVQAIDPWENVEIDPATGHLAEEAAAAAGLSVEEWLERAIRRACPSGFLTASLTIPAMPAVTPLFAAPVAPSPATVAEPPAPLRRARAIAELLAQEHLVETKALEVLPVGNNARNGEDEAERADPLPRVVAQDGQARDTEPAPKRKSAKRLVLPAIAIALAITGGAVTAQYLIPGHARAPTTPSNNSAPARLASLPPAAPEPSVISLVTPTGAADTTPSTTSKENAAASEAPAALDAAPTQTANTTTTSRPGKDDVAPTDPKALAVWLEQRATNGDNVAQYRLGVLYALGQGVPQDYQHAAELFKTSAESGVAEAQYNIGVMYGNGLGIGRDPGQAAQWYQKAAAQGNARAAFNLGDAYSSGVGVQKNMDQAAQWFRRAATLGIVNAQFNLGLLYERGDGVPVSQVEAYAWYSAAAARGDGGATLRRDHLASTLGPATLKEALSRAQKIAATIRDGGERASGALATGSATKAAATSP